MPPGGLRALAGFLPQVFRAGSLPEPVRTGGHSTWSVSPSEAAMALPGPRDRTVRPRTRQPHLPPSPRGLKAGSEDTAPRDQVSIIHSSQRWKLPKYPSFSGRVDRKTWYGHTVGVMQPTRKDILMAAPTGWTWRRLGSVKRAAQHGSCRSSPCVRSWSCQIHRGQWWGRGQSSVWEDERRVAGPW